MVEHDVLVVLGAKQGETGLFGDSSVTSEAKAGDSTETISGGGMDDDEESNDLIQENSPVHAKTELSSPPPPPPRESSTRGGIEVITNVTNLFFGACGATSQSSEHADGVYVLDESDVSIKGEQKTAAQRLRVGSAGTGTTGSTGANEAEMKTTTTTPRRKHQQAGGGSSFGTPDRAAGAPVVVSAAAAAARDASHRSHLGSSSVSAAGAGAAARRHFPSETTAPGGATNELHQIAKAGDWSKLRECLTSVTNHSKTVSAAGQVDEKGRTPLMLACMQGANFPADVARLLLVANNQSASVYVLQRNGGKQFCLHVATSYGCNIEVLGILHGAYPKAASTLDGNGNMPLHLAVNNGRYRSIAGQLEMRGEDMASTIITEYNHTGDFRHDCDESLGGESISNPSLNSGGGHCGGGTAATADIMVNVCEFLVTANPPALVHRNRRGETPLLLAIYRRSPSDVISLLLVRGGAPALRIEDDYGSYPIHFCDRSPSLSLVRDMASLFPEGIAKQNQTGNTPLFSAVATSSCDIAVLRTLLECCARPRATVERKNGDGINIIAFGWDDLSTPKVVAAEDQDDEDARLEDCRDLIENAVSPSNVAGKYIGNWWAKASLLLKAAYHNTIKQDEKEDHYGGRLWRPVHAVVGVECPSKMVKFVLQIYADEAGMIDENMNAPLHIAVSRPDIIPAETVQLVLDANPSSALMQNKDGLTPLMVACLFKAKLEVINLLLATSPEAASIQNSEGQTALFLALSVGSSVDVLRAVLKAQPQSVHIRDYNGISSIALSWHMLLSGKVFEERGAEKKSEAKRSNANVASLAVISRSSSLKGDIRSWMSKIDLLLRAAFHGTIAESLPKGRQWRAVHAACSGGTVPPDVLAFALQILPSEADAANEGRDYPLHIASFAPPYEENCPPQLGSGASIDLLLKTSSIVAKKTNRKGRLPIHLALDSGKTWNNGVSHLLASFPESVRMRDPHSMLYPFMLAAGPQNLRRGEVTIESVDLAVLNTTFMLLREAPDMISSPRNSNAEIAFLRRSRRELVLEKEQLKEKLSGVEADLRKRMAASEVKAIEEGRKREASRQQEERRRLRANHLEVQVRQMTKTLSSMARSTMSLKDEGL